MLILDRKSPSWVRLRNLDRVILVWPYRLFPALLNAITVVKPETVIRWHRRGFPNLLALEVSAARADQKLITNFEI